MSSSCNDRVIVVLPAPSGPINATVTTPWHLTRRWMNDRYLERERPCADTQGAKTSPYRPPCISRPPSLISIPGGVQREVAVSQVLASAVDAAAVPVRSHWRGRLLNEHVRVAALLAFDTIAFVATVTAMGVGTHLAVVYYAAVVAGFVAAGMYRPRLLLSALDDVPCVVAAFGAGAIAVVTVYNAVVGSVPSRVLVAAPVLIVAALTARAVAYAGLHWARRTGLVTHRALLVGGGRVANGLSQELIEHPEYGLTPVGYLDDRPLVGASDWPVPCVGGCEDLANVIRKLDVGNVIVAFGSGRESAMVDVLRTCDRFECDILYVPRLFELSAAGRTMDLVWGTTLVRLPRAPFRSPAWQVKRLIDIVLSGLALVVMAPVMLVCALLVKINVGSPVLFRQQRLGLDQKPFTLYKFCTLRPGSSQEGSWSIADDARVGRVGRLLRRTSLDELPQLWNVLRGDMSLVGPRPERPVFAARFGEEIPRYAARHRFPAGLTGLAQVHGLRGDTSIAHRARFDNLYIENWSLWGDAKILLRTVGQLFRASGR